MLMALLFFDGVGNLAQIAGVAGVHGAAGFDGR